MKKRAVSAVVSVLFVALSIFAAAPAFKYFLNESTKRATDTSVFEDFLGLIITLLVPFVAMLLHVIIHESGHLVFGFLSGYRFVSFRIFSLTLVKKSGKFALKKYSIPGSAGQCLLAPKVENSTKTPIFVYNIGGGLMNIIASAVLALVAVLTFDTELGFKMCAVFVGEGILFALVNVLPMRFGAIANDGYNALMLMRSPAANRAFSIQLSVNAAQTDGKSLADMPDEWFVFPSDGELSNIHVAALGYVCAQRMLYSEQIREAKEALLHLLETANLLPIYDGLIRADIAYCLAVSGGSADEIKAMLNGNAKKIIKSMSRHPSVIRADYAIAKFFGEEKRAEALARRLAAVGKNHPYPIAEDVRLIALADERISSLR